MASSNGSREGKVAAAAPLASIWIGTIRDDDVVNIDIFDAVGGPLCVIVTVRPSRSQVRLSSAACSGLPNRAMLKLRSWAQRQTPVVAGMSCQSIEGGNRGGGGGDIRTGRDSATGVCTGPTHEHSSSNVPAPNAGKAPDASNRVGRSGFIALLWDQAPNRTTPINRELVSP